MLQFTSEEINLICLYDPTGRKDAISALREMMKDLMPDETDLESLAKSAIAKLESITDTEFDRLSRNWMISWLPNDYDDSKADKIIPLSWYEDVYPKDQFQD